MEIELLPTSIGKIAHLTPLPSILVYHPVMRLFTHMLNCTRTGRITRIIANHEIGLPKAAEDLSLWEPNLPPFHTLCQHHGTGTNTTTLTAPRHEQTNSRPAATCVTALSSKKATRVGLKRWMRSPCPSWPSSPARAGWEGTPCHCFAYRPQGSLSNFL